MVQPGGDLDLAQEPVGAQRLRQLGPEHLYRHLAVVSQVLGQIHRGHAPLVQLPHEAVAVGQGGGQAIDRSVHNVEDADSDAPARDWRPSEAARVERQRGGGVLSAR